MKAFVSRGQITKVVVNSGTRRRVPEEIDALRCRRALVLSTPWQTEQATEIADLLGDVAGGSTLGLGKAVARRTGLPQLGLPTTHTGSEMTPILGETGGSRKITVRLPEIPLTAVVHDAALTLLTSAWAGEPPTPGPTAKTLPSLTSGERHA